MHIRRGDRHASTFPYRGSHIPLENYVSAAFSAWNRLYDKTSPADARDDSAPTPFPAPPILYAASDAHAVVEEFMSAFPSSSAVFSLASSTDPGLRALVPQSEYVQEEFDILPEADRVRLTRGMVVDLAMLSGLWAWEGDIVPGATICTIRSAAFLRTSLWTLLNLFLYFQLEHMQAICTRLRMGPRFRVRRRRESRRRQHQRKQETLDRSGWEGYRQPRMERF